jgi:uncharacterized membrane protein
MDRSFFVWTLLVGLTFFAFIAGFFKVASGIFTAVLLVSTFVKGFLVIEDFMNLSEVKVKYRILPTLWLGGVMLFIAATYYV